MKLKYIKSIKVTCIDGSWRKLTKPEDISEWLTLIVQDNIVIGEKK